MMKMALALVISACASAPALAVTVSYNTIGSTLSCSGVAGCVQDSSTSITDAGITLTYYAGSGTNVDVASGSFIGLGNVVTTGTGIVDLRGAQLTININSTPPGGSAVLPPGTVGGFGNITTNSSLEFLQFAPANTTTTLGGTMPGVQIGDFIFQVYQPGQFDYGLEAPTIGNPIGETTITGVVSTVPEAPGALMLLSGLAIFGSARRARRAGDRSPLHCV